MSLLDAFHYVKELFPARPDPMSDSSRSKEGGLELEALTNWCRVMRESAWSAGYYNELIEAALAEIRPHAARVPTDGLSLVDTSRYAPFVIVESLLRADLDKDRNAHPFIPHALMLASCSPYMPRHLVLHAGEYLICPRPVGEAPSPAGWLPLTMKDTPAVLETLGVLLKDGMKLAEALPAARKLS